MHQNYNQDQERLANIVADVTKTGVSVGAQIAMMPRHKPVKVEIRTAADDVLDVRQGLKQGKSAEEIAKSIQQSSVAQGIVKAGNDLGQYAQLIAQKAEMENASERMPSSLQQKRTRQKTL